MGLWIKGVFITAFVGACLLIGGRTDKKAKATKDLEKVGDFWNAEAYQNLAAIYVIGSKEVPADAQKVIEYSKKPVGWATKGRACSMRKMIKANKV